MIADLQKKYQVLEEILKKLDKLILAYSGGVDSTFLLKAAVDSLGKENVIACIAVSPSLSKSQYEQAIQCAKNIGIDVEKIQLDELADSDYAANKADRCFHCKSHLFGALTKIAGEKGFENIICGSNFNDKDDYRPGNRAAEVFNVRAPLTEAALTKDDIRQLSRELGLKTADIPASPCLASRLVYGLEITEGRLKQIEEAEEFLKKLGLVEFRVRHHNQIARIEVHPEDINIITEEPNRSKITEAFKKLGFKYVTLDLQGFRSGSLNETLTDEQKRKNG